MKQEIRTQDKNAEVLLILWIPKNICLKRNRIWKCLENWNIFSK